MSIVKYIFAQPDYIEGIGNVYPIKLKDYDEFQECSKILYISKNNFIECDNVPLLALIFIYFEQLGLTEQELVISLENLFSLVLKETVKLKTDEKTIWFEINNSDNIINFNNYDVLRSVIMKQNLMHEPKIYKTKLMNQWAEKALKAKQKNAPNITLEDIISTVSVGCHKHYWDLENYTIYQLYSDFYRLRKTIEYDTSIQFQCVSTKDLKIQDYAESLDLFHNPYDDLFVSSDKLSGLNKAIK